MAQKSEEIMPDPDAIIRLRRDRLLGANLTGCDVNFCWMIQIRKFDESSAPPLIPWKDEFLFLSFACSPLRGHRPTSNYYAPSPRRLHAVWWCVRGLPVFGARQFSQRSWFISSFHSSSVLKPGFSHVKFLLSGCIRCFVSFLGSNLALYGNLLYL